MRIGIVWHCVYPWDIRIEKFCRSALLGGHSVVVVSRGDGKLPQREEADGVRHYRLDGRKAARYSRVLGKLWAAPLFFNPVWLQGLRRIVRQERLELLVVRDLPMALAVGIVGKLAGVPVVLDMAENYPAALLTYQKALYRPFLFGNALLPRVYERLSLRLMAAVLVVADEQKARLERQGVAAGRIAVVMNTPELTSLERLAAMEEAGTPGGRYILYSGFMDRHRGLRSLVLAFNEIRDRYPDLRLVLIGKGNEYDELVALAKELGVADRVLFKGWLDFRRIPGYIRGSTVCVIPHLRSEHTDTTVPNKIFDYLFFGRPMVVSDCSPLRRLAEELRCGLVFRSGDHRDLARALRSVLDDGWPEGEIERGRTLIRSKYNWDNDARILLELLAGTVAAGKGVAADRCGEGI